MQSINRYLFPLLGLTLLVAVLARADLNAVWSGIVSVGWWGIVAVLAIHFVSFLGDVVLWQLAYDELPFNPRWCTRFYGVRLIGEAYNNATPFASVGGEPVKAKLLKDRYDISYDASAAAFLIAKTANLLALCAFLAIGFAAMLFDERFAPLFKGIAAAGLLAFAFGIVLLVSAQASGIVTRVGRRLASPGIGSRVRAVFQRIEALDMRLGKFYDARNSRLLGTVFLAFLTWVAGIFEIWIVLFAIGTPISLLDAWIVEALAQLIRTAVFFIPSGLGVVDASFVVVISVLTGNPDHGVVVAIARRFRDLVWIAWGMVLAFLPSRTPRCDKDRSFE